MKKLLSLALVTSLLLGSTSMEAGNKLKKTWAYTKIGLGGVNLLVSGLAIYDIPLQIKKIKAYRNMQKDSQEKSFGLDFTSNIKKELVKLTIPVPLIPLGIFCIKSGTRDLKRIREQELKDI